MKKEDIERILQEATAHITASSNEEEVSKYLNALVVRLKDDCEFERTKKLTQIGIALSTEHNINRLLEMIVDEARWITHADGGTLYITSEDEKHLNFAIVQNDSLQIRMGGTGTEITWPPVPLRREDGCANDQNVSAYAATSGEIVNIADVYETVGFDFKGMRHFDSETGYRSRSMLVVPMYNHENDIIGVLQLLNAKDPDTNEVIGFSPESEQITEAMASQAAVALTNRLLIHNLQNLFEAFITSIATAIDEKSPYTGGHVRRVAELVMSLAKKINETKEGQLADISFTEDQMKELRMAAWLHDVGKITTPEYIVDKATRLQTIVDRIDVIQLRAEIIKKDHIIECLRKNLATMSEATEDQTELDHDPFLETLEEDLEFLTRINQGETWMDDEKLSHLQQISERTWENYEGDDCLFILPEEMQNLRIRKGTLTDGERSVINNHALLTEKILSSLPFPKKLKRVPEFASAHHEQLNGRGYPHGLKGDELALQSRIIAAADVFEALTAKDRPYKKSKTPTEALEIMTMMVRDGHLDADLIALLRDAQVYSEIL